MLAERLTLLAFLSLPRCRAVTPRAHRRTLASESNVQVGLASAGLAAFLSRRIQAVSKPSAEAGAMS